MSPSRRFVAVAGVFTVTGCAHSAWMADESSRIDEVMRDDRFEPSRAGAQGIAVIDAPPLAEPWKEGEGYRITPPSQGRKVRLGKGERRKPAQP